METGHYTCTGGLQLVRPYLFEFSVPVKGRWVGHTVLDLFANEFPYYSREYYHNKIQKGWITVNARSVRPDEVLRFSSRHSRAPPPLVHHSKPLFLNALQFCKCLRDVQVYT